MSSDIFVIYQIDNSEKNREYRCRSYEYQIQHGFMDNSVEVEFKCSDPYQEVLAIMSEVQNE